MHRGYQKIRNKSFTRFPVLTVFVSLLLHSCNYFKYPGFKPAGKGVYCKLVQIGETDTRPYRGDFLTVILSYRNMNDSLFFHGVRRFVFEPGNTAAPDFLFRKMSPGDSMIYILPADSFFRNTLNRELPRFLHDGDKMKMEIRLLNIRSAADYENDKKEFLKWAEEKKVNEDTLIRAFLRNNHYPTAPLEEGFYMIPLKEGRGPLLKNGDHIWISYNGKFLDGEYFDQSLTPEEPMDFIYGTGMYLIRGLELCLSYMHVGEKSMVILPSALAFGNEGSSNGMIPPFTPVIYEIEVLKVN